MKKILILLFGISAALHGQGIPYGQEFPVSSFQDDILLSPSIAGLSDQKYFVCWESGHADPSGYGIFGQLFNPDGIRLGFEFPVHTTFSGDQKNPAAAALSPEGFVVCWQSVPQAGQASGLFVQAFDSAGRKTSPEFQVNTSPFTFIENDNFYPSIISLLDGEFFIFWHAWAEDEYQQVVYGQKFRNSGSRDGGEFMVRSQSTLDAINPSAARLDEGRFLVSWSQMESEGDYNIYAQIFKNTGIQEGTAFRINTGDSFGQWWPTAASLRNGGAVICWSDGDPSSYSVDVRCRILDSSGQKQSDEFQANTYQSSWQGRQFVTGLTDGGFLVLWQSMDQDGSGWGVFGQFFNGAGGRRGYEFRLNDCQENWQVHPCVSPISADQLLVCWAGQYQFDNPYAIVGKYYPAVKVPLVLGDFTLIEPGQDATVSTTRPAFQWNKASDAATLYPWELRYKIFLDTDPSWPHPSVIDNIADTTYEADPSSADTLLPGATYFWKVLAENSSGDSLWSSNVNGFFVRYDATNSTDIGRNDSPEGYRLSQNHPNPFNSETLIRFDLASMGSVHIAIHDIQGRLIRVLLDETRSAGSQSVKWDGEDSSGMAMPSGIYICRLNIRTPNGKVYSESRKMGLVR